MSPREAEAVAVAADALDGAGDPAALVVALVAELARRGRLPEREVAVVLARVIEGHPEGAGMVRMLDARGDSSELYLFESTMLFSCRWNSAASEWLIYEADYGAPQDSHPTREAAEAALIAAQPVPAAVVRVRE